jgi:hypothetical protein
LRQFENCISTSVISDRLFITPNLLDPWSWCLGVYTTRSFHWCAINSKLNCCVINAARIRVVSLLTCQRRQSHTSLLNLIYFAHHIVLLSIIFQETYTLFAQEDNLRGGGLSLAIILCICKRFAELNAVRVFNLCKRQRIQ